MSSTFDEFSSRLAADGYEAAIEYLNKGVPHRYTGIYRLKDGVMKNIALSDKEDEIKPDFLAEVPFEESFCQFVLRDGCFRMSDSTTDERVDSHKYKGVLLAYSGVPVDDGKGGLWGTLCHFDAQSIELSEEDFQLLKRAAKALGPYVV